MKIELPPEVLDVKKWECTVKSNRSVATFIKELVVELPKGETIDCEFKQYNVRYRVEQSDYNCDT